MLVERESMPNLSNVLMVKCVVSLLFVTIFNELKYGTIHIFHSPIPLRQFVSSLSAISNERSTYTRPQFRPNRQKLISSSHRLGTKLTEHLFRRRWILFCFFPILDMQDLTSRMHTFVHACDVHDLPTFFFSPVRAGTFLVGVGFKLLVTMLLI